MTRTRRVVAFAFGLFGLIAAAAGCEPDDTYDRAGFPTYETTGPEAAPHHGTPYDSGLNLPQCASVYPGDAPASGVWTISTQATYEGCMFRGDGITVTADNVVLRAMAIVGDRNLLVQNQGTGLSIEYSVIIPDPEGDFVGAGGEPCQAAIAFGNFELIGSEVSGCADGMKVSGNVALTGNFVHDLWKGCHPVNTSTCTHNDIMQYPENSGTQGTIIVSGNAFYMDSCTSNRHFQAKNFTGTVVWEDNFIYGGNGLQMNDGTGGGSTVTLNGNTFAGSKTSGPFNTNQTNTQMIGLLGGSYASVSHDGLNVYEDSSAVDPGDWRESPYSCAAMPPPTSTTSTTGA